METTTIKVEGMHCPKCEMRVEKVLLKQAGVAAAKADHTADSVEVTFDPAVADKAAWAAAITELEFVPGF